ncbi:CD83 antigen [Thunnus maccoyii]|uniref:CD83 antigen n=1 Tax=Thunnus maccoyii TaxID=8240 RepID=UPI001C4C1364|nr:CD83 antigen [Thunnus maccoyii]XP_042280489.1 CD83 antigen [Thunnus maccoyii]
MTPHLLNCALLLSHCVCLAVGMSVSKDMMEVVTYSGSDAPLQCTARYKPGVQYRAVRWYKVGEPPSPRLSGLLTKDLPNGTTRWYLGLDREVELLDETRNILLPNVTCSDSGVYMCRLEAPVGEQNQEGQILLILADCADNSTEELMTDTYLVILATAVLMFALVTFLISYGSLKNILKDRSKTILKETLLDAPLKPLQKKDLKLIYTLGPNVSKKPTMKHICV